MPFSITLCHNFLHQRMRVWSHKEKGPCRIWRNPKTLTWQRIMPWNFETGPWGMLKRNLIEPHHCKSIFFLYTFSSSGGGPQMYSITDVSRGLKRSAAYSVKPLSSTNSERSRPPKYLELLELLSLFHSRTVSCTETFMNIYEHVDSTNSAEQTC